MLLSKETTIKLNNAYSNIIGHMCYAAYKLWNICNYERIHYREMGLEKYPDWFYQKAAHKENMWYKSLHSQTAQEVCKQLDKGWKSFYKLQKTKGIKNPHPPYFKNAGIAVTYMQKGIVHEQGEDRVRLSLAKNLKRYMSEKYDIHEEYLYLKNKFFQDMDIIKQIKIYPPEKDGTSRIIAIYETANVEMYPENGHCLSIDLGLHNLVTCYDNEGKSFILGRKYLEITRKYDKEISRVQSQWARIQVKKGVKYPKPSRHVKQLYAKKKNCVKDYLNKVTVYIARYCEENEIHTVVIGDLKGIRKDKDMGNKNNQKLHGLPYEQIYRKLKYKLEMRGITIIKQKEAYSSQCSPTSKDVSKKSAQKGNRKCRGLYVEKSGQIYNADAVGAYNIMRKNNAVTGRKIEMPISGLKQIDVIKVAV